MADLKTRKKVFTKDGKKVNINEFGNDAQRDINWDYIFDATAANNIEIYIHWNPHYGSQQIKNVFVYLGDGDDVFVDKVKHGAHDKLFHLIEAGAGDDTIRLHNYNKDRKSSSNIAGGSGADSIDTRSGDDVIYGDRDIFKTALKGGPIDGVDYNDIIYSRGGDDTVHGEYGNDRIFGGDGDDYISGSIGNDILFGGSGSDTIHGGEGHDMIDVGPRDGKSVDTVYTGPGSDLVVIGAIQAVQSIDGVDWDDLGDVGETAVADTANIIATEILKQMLIQGQNNTNSAGELTMGPSVIPTVRMVGMGISAVVEIINLHRQNKPAKIEYTKADNVTVEDFNARYDSLIYNFGSEIEFLDHLGTPSVKVDTAGKLTIETDQLSNNAGGIIATLIMDDEAVNSFGSLTAKFAGRESGNITRNFAEMVAETSVLIERSSTNIFRINDEDIDTGNLYFALDSLSLSQAVANKLTSLNLQVGQKVLLLNPAGNRVLVGSSLTTDIKNIIGGEGDDIIYAGQQDNSIVGGLAYIAGYGGDDMITDGSNNDFLYGGTGNDLIRLLRHDGEDDNDDKDIIGYTKGDGDDTITGFDVNQDTLRLEGMGHPSGFLVTLIDAGDNPDVPWANDVQILFNDGHKIILENIGADTNLNAVHASIETWDPILESWVGSIHLDGRMEEFSITAPYTKPTQTKALDAKPYTHLSLMITNLVTGESFEEAFQDLHYIYFEDGPLAFKGGSASNETFILNSSQDMMIFGNQGNDTIYPVYMDRGFDYIFGGYGDDILASVNGYSSGGPGSDFYLYKPNWGEVTIQDAGDVEQKKDVDILAIESGDDRAGARDQVHIVREADDLILVGADWNGYVRLVNGALAGQTDSIEKFYFGATGGESGPTVSTYNAHTATHAEILEDAVHTDNFIWGGGLGDKIDGTPEEDHIVTEKNSFEAYGYEGNDTFVVSADGIRKQFMYGGKGDDTFEVGQADRVDADGSWGNDTASYSTASERIMIKLKDPGAEWDGGTSTTHNTHHLANQIKNVDPEEGLFAGAADGHNLRYIENLIGSNYNDIIFGNSKDNILRGLRGDDMIDGGGGNDLFIYHDGDGRDVIDNFVAGKGSDDIVQLSGVAPTTFDELMTLATHDGAHTVISFDAKNAILLLGVDKSDLDYDDFEFV